MLPIIPDITAAIWRFVAQIPPGRVATYGDVARALGDVIASRHVGFVMLHHEHSVDCLCHRLVRADGSLGKYVTGHLPTKHALLTKEGVTIQGEKVPLTEFVFSQFTGPRPLESLAEFQKQVAAGVRLPMTSTGSLDVVAGVDVSFVPNSDLAVAAFAEVDLGLGQLGYHTTLCQPVRFPYISSYLAFRELPLLVALMDQVARERELPSIVMVDGSGVLHPRHAGIATMLGVTRGLKTIGVTKKHLVGQVETSELDDVPREIVHAGELRGFAVRPASGSHKPLYVSPGNGVDVRTALAVVSLAQFGRRLPEPIYWADRLSRAAARQLMS